MSIIDDALNKTQSDLEKTTDKPTAKPKETFSQRVQPSTSSPQTPSPKPKQKQKNKPKMSLRKLSLFLLLIVGILSCAVFFTFKNLPELKNKLPPLPLGKALKKKIPTIKPKTKPLPSISHNGLVLNGTTMVDNKYRALINNKIYKVGETVKGKEITNISMEQVELTDAAGNITILKQ